MASPETGYQDFCNHVLTLLEDRDFPGTNVETRDFLEALVAWLADTRGGTGHFGDSPPGAISWTDLAMLIEVSGNHE